MPGPVSDSYDPEFGTGERRGDVDEALRLIDVRLTAKLGERLRDIVDVARSEDTGTVKGLPFSQRELRLIRFAIRRARESL